jgi:hypothetical protein
MGATLAIVDELKSIAKLPYPAILLLFGAIAVGVTFISPDGKRWFSVHAPEPQAWFSVLIGVSLILLSFASYIVNRWHVLFATKSEEDVDFAASAGLDASKVRIGEGQFSTRVGDCLVSVVFSRVEEWPPSKDTIFVLPCNEFFDRACVMDPKCLSENILNHWNRL